MGSKQPWIIRGNIVTVTDDPFNCEQTPRIEATSIDLGAGITILLDHIIFVDEQGIIDRLVPSRIVGQDELEKLMKSDSFLHLEIDEFLCPGLIDLHIHAPQYAYTGTATDRPLMGEGGWLESYAFPAERRLAEDIEMAHEVYQCVVQRTLRAGTTTAVYYGTLHLEPCKVLVDIALKMGQRALIGKVCMDRNSPTSYCQTVEENVQETEHLIKYIHSKAGPESAGRDGPNRRVQPLVLPVITPRFIPTCSPMLLMELGKLAAKYDCHIQTHLSESHDEVAYSRHLDAHEDWKDGSGRTDAEILDHHNLLTEKCVLAHAVLMTESDKSLIRERGSSVAHCPLSNFFFAGCSLHCRELVQMSIKLGLGTDVAGGYSPSMMDSCRAAVIASRAIEHSCLTECGCSKRASHHVMDYRHAFVLATAGGAKSLGMQGRIGNLQTGAEFDAMVLSASSGQTPVQVFGEDTISDIFQKILVMGDDRNVRRVFVQGRVVKF